MEKAFISLSTKSWHYKLIHLVLGSAAPTPQNMHNFCPYFWLLVFSLLTCWVVVPVRLIFKVLGAVAEAIDKLIEYTLIIPTAVGWYNDLDDLQIYRLWCGDIKIEKNYRKLHKLSSNYWERKMLAEEWWEKKFGKPVNIHSANLGRDTWSDEFYEWFNAQQIKWDKLKLEAEIHRKANPTYSDKLEVMRDDVGDFFGKVSNSVTSWKGIIKWTKRVTGALITGILLFISYFAVTYAGLSVCYG
jgi:hypothetical protein